MFINIVKFIHLLCVLGLLGLVVNSLVALSLRKFSRNPANKAYLINQNKNMLWLAIFAVLTGTLLVYPKHFTFHTPWIEAAYLLVTLFIIAVFVLKRLPNLPNYLKIISYILLITLLVCVIHDAVTKTALIPI